MADDFQGVDRRAAGETGKWRADTTQAIELLKHQQNTMAIEQTNLASQIAHNTKVTEDVKANTDEIVKVFKAIKGSLTVAGWLGKAAKWITVCAIGIGIVIYIFKTGELPKK